MLGAIRGDTDAVVAPLAAIRRMRGSNATQMRLLASFEQSSSEPGVPDAADLGQPELASITVQRVLAGPPGLSGPVSDFLSEELLKCAEDETVQAYSRRLGEALDPQGEEQAARFAANQQRFVTRWQSVLRLT